jgi:hypothetical protein
MKDDVAATKSILDQLLDEAHLYKRSAHYKELLDFVVRLRNFAPFNAMLLQIQKPGLTYAASAYQWRTLFGRHVRPYARPLLILWPFGPVVPVYDVMDTEGDRLPRDLETFWARGPIDQAAIHDFLARMDRRHIHCLLVDQGDGRAGSIRRLRPLDEKSESFSYEVTINQNHPSPTQFATIVHELAHLFLCHLGPDRKLKIPHHSAANHDQSEIEAESVCYLVCRRNGVATASEAYLSSYLKTREIVGLNVHALLRAAGGVETLLGLSIPMDFGTRPPPAQTSLF